MADKRKLQGGLLVGMCSVVILNNAHHVLSLLSHCFLAHRRDWQMFKTSCRGSWHIRRYLAKGLSEFHLSVIWNSNFPPRFTLLCM